MLDIILLSFLFFIYTQHDLIFQPNMRINKTRQNTYKNKLDIISIAFSDLNKGLMFLAYFVWFLFPFNSYYILTDGLLIPSREFLYKFLFVYKVNSSIPDSAPKADTYYKID